MSIACMTDLMGRPLGHTKDCICSECRAADRKLSLLRELSELRTEVARLQRIIDSRPAVNAGLPQTYIEWSRGIYAIEISQSRSHGPLCCSVALDATSRPACRPPTDRGIN